MEPWKEMLLILSRNSQNFMEAENSLSCLQQPATGRRFKVHESSPNLPSYFLKIHFNIIFPSAPITS
jgi:hypothetical protein